MSDTMRIRDFNLNSVNLSDLLFGTISSKNQAIICTRVTYRCHENVTSFVYGNHNGQRDGYQDIPDLGSTTIFQKWQTEAASFGQIDRAVSLPGVPSQDRPQP